MQNALSYNLTLISLFCRFLSGRFTQVILYYCKFLYSSPHEPHGAVKIMSTKQRIQASCVIEEWKKTIWPLERKQFYVFLNEIVTTGANIQPSKNFPFIMNLQRTEL